MTNTATKLDCKTYNIGLRREDGYLRPPPPPTPGWVNSSPRERIDFALSTTISVSGANTNLLIDTSPDPTDTTSSPNHLGVLAPI